MTSYVIGNWKMHGSMQLAQALSQAAIAAAHAAGAGTQVVLCPPAPYLTVVAAHLAGSPVALGGQDCHAQREGAFTGDVSAAMLKEVGCRYVIVGHSERRQYHGETDEAVRAKAEAALSAGLTPVICVGESLEDRQAGRAEAVVAAQLAGCLPKQGKFILAYEPIWAIGTGLTATASDIAAMHRHIGSLAGGFPVLYGGSVKAENAASLLALPGVGGVLVGGASVSAEAFTAIINASHAAQAASA